GSAETALSLRFADGRVDVACADESRFSAGVDILRPGVGGLQRHARFEALCVLKLQRVVIRPGRVRDLEDARVAAIGTARIGAALLERNEAWGGSTVEQVGIDLIERHTGEDRRALVNDGLRGRDGELSAILPVVENHPN